MRTWRCCKMLPIRVSDNTKERATKLAHRAFTEPRSLSRILISQIRMLCSRTKFTMRCRRKRKCCKEFKVLGRPKLSSRLGDVERKVRLLRSCAGGGSKSKDSRRSNELTHGLIMHL